MSKTVLDEATRAALQKEDELLKAEGERLFEAREKSRLQFEADSRKVGVSRTQFEADTAMLNNWVARVIEAKQYPSDVTVDIKTLLPVKSGK